MNKILILFAHPRFEKSKTNRALLKNIERQEGITFNDLYEQYPDFNIDVAREKELLVAHQVIIWHHPFYMYSAPALIKQWIDLVLEYGWAHGRGGDFLKNKIIFNVLTSGGTRGVYAAAGYTRHTIGGTREVYATAGYNRHTIREFLVPFEQTASLCKMIYLPPFAVQGTHLLTDEALQRHVVLYRALLSRLVKGEFDVEEMKKVPYLNDWILSAAGLPKP
jgi:glutathione-regulated potassium-efflux system ancillary protein KefG